MLNPVIGQRGRLLEIPFTATENVSRNDRYVEEITVEGRRRVQARPATPRSWDVSVPLGGSNDLAVLSEFFVGGWGNGPWVWIPVAAQVGNLLTPTEAALVEYRTVGGYLSDGGPMLLSDGTWAGRSVNVDLDSGWIGVNGRDIPVIPGKPVTWAADLEGDSPQLHLQFFNDAGGNLGIHTSSGSGSGPVRRSVTATAPPGAVYASVGIRAGTTRVARPQVTWTPRRVPWSAGHGCAAAVIEGLTEELLTVDHVGPQSSASFTVLEVS